MADREVKHGRDTRWPHPSQAKDFNTTRRSCDRQKSETKVETFHKDPNFENKVNCHQIARSSHPDWSFVETFINCRCKDSPDRIKVKAEFSFSLQVVFSWTFSFLDGWRWDFHLGWVSSTFLEQLIHASFDNPSVIVQRRNTNTKAEKYNLRSSDLPQFTCHWLFGGWRNYSEEAKLTPFCVAMCEPFTHRRTSEYSPCGFELRFSGRTKTALYGWLYVQMDPNNHPHFLK